MSFLERKSKLLADHAKGYISNAQFAREMALLEADPKYRRRAGSKASWKAAALSRSTAGRQQKPRSSKQRRGHRAKST